MEYFDVIVVGSGIAGISASIAAAEKGASVLVLERGHGGGTSALSGGVFYAGGGTKYQQAAGCYDTPENMFAYLRQETGNVVEETTLHEFCATSVESLEWLEKHGAQFESSLCPYPTAFPVDRHCLLYSGSERSHPFSNVAVPAPRGHKMAHPGFAGMALWQALFCSAMRLGVQFLPATKVDEVVHNHSIEGVKCRTLCKETLTFFLHRTISRQALKLQIILPHLALLLHRGADVIWRMGQRKVTLRAPAVILAAGGFAFNSEMRQEHLRSFSYVGGLGTPADDGAGIKLGIAAGGSTSQMDRMCAWRFIYPPTALVEGIVVSQQGHRIGNEDLYGGHLTEIIMKNADGKAFLILDSNHWAKARLQLPEQTSSLVRLQRTHWLYWGHKKSHSLQLLAEKLGICANGLRQTVNSYNRAIKLGEADGCHKASSLCTPILQPPFYGIDISITTKSQLLQPVLGLTLGGLRVDETNGQVLRADNTSITGLFAAGRTAVGICSNKYVSGLSLADAVFSGRRAGTHAATG